MRVLLKLMYSLGQFLVSFYDINFTTTKITIEDTEQQILRGQKYYF